MSMASSLAPAFLLSMPQLVDPNFNRTVVLLCKHSEEGAFGLVMNRPLITTGRVVVNLEAASAGGVKRGAERARAGANPRETVSTDQDLQVWVGGPVEPHRSWILVGEDPNEREEMAGMRISDGLYLSTSPDLLRRMLEPMPPPRARLIVGYSGWGPGQLEAELQSSAWLISDIDRDLIFATAPDRMWEAGIRRLGADPAALQTSRGVH